MTFTWRTPRALVMWVLVASCGFPRPPDVAPDGAPDAPPEGPAYQLLAIRPAIAMTGDTLTLEGTFGSNAIVQFPGGATQAATVLGEHRAAVVVPEAATAGDLTVSTGDVTTGPVTFRRTSFALGLQPFRITYEQTDGARQSPTLRIPRSESTAVRLKTWVYVVGGDDGNGPVNSVERAATNADDTLDAFEVVGDVSLGEARSGHTSAVIGNALYVIGGMGNSGPLGSIERAAINADGTVGRFATTDATLTTARRGHTSAIIGSYLYVIGGARGDGTKLDSIERAPIRADGTLGAFSVIAAHLTTARSDHALEVIGNALYVLGGSTASNVPTASVELAAIDGDGSLGAFGPSPGGALGAARSGLRSVVLGAVLYIVGGSLSIGPTTGFESAPIGANGVVGPFAGLFTARLRAARNGAAIVAVGNTLHVIGGKDTGPPIPSVEHGSLNADIAISSFATSGSSLVLPRTHDVTRVIRESLYAIGRSGVQNTIERASIRIDGSLGAFTTYVGVSLGANRGEHSTAVVGKYLYVIGGIADDTFLTSIERAPINPDGSLGPFASVSNNLQQPRTGHLSVVLGSFVYVIGGVTNGGTRLTSIERASISGDGTLGSFATVPGIGLNTGRNFFTALATDQYLYVIAGLDGTGLGTASIERSPIGSDGSLGAFSVVGSIVESRGTHAGALIGNAYYVIGGLNVGGMRSSVERAAVDADGNLSGFEFAFGITMTRARHTAAVAGNMVYVIGGQNETAVVLDVARAELR